MPTPDDELPRYRRVTDELRRRIQAGVIPAGSVLPSESRLMTEFNVSRGTVRQAMVELRTEGLVVTEHGRGTYARPLRPVRRVSSERYRRELAQLNGGAPQTAFTSDHALAWADYQLDRDFRTVPAPGDVAELFGIHAGTDVLERRFIFRAYGVPQQLSISYLLSEMVARTPVADPTNEPWPGGNIAQFASLGITVTGIRERVRARMPTGEERAALPIPAGIPVVVVTRQTYAGEQVVEVARDIVMPADRVELDYYIDLR